MPSERKLYSPTINDLLKAASPPEPENYLHGSLIYEFGINERLFSWTDEQKARIASTSLYSWPFGNEEEAMAKLFYFDNKPFLLCQNYGESHDYDNQIVDQDSYNAAARYLLSIELECRMKDLGKYNNASEPSFAKNQRYIAFSNGDKGVAVHMLAPRDCNFSRLFESHEAFYEEEPVSFVRWEYPALRSSYDDDSELVVISTPAGKEMIVDGCAIAFVFKDENMDLDAEHSPC